MNRTTRQWARLVVLIVFALGTVVARAQQGGTLEMTAERSWAIQRTLQSIDADREMWVNNLVSRWASVLDPALYDLAGELAPRARIAPAWQLYGASVANDFRTMMQILRGKQSAGAYINGPSSPSAGVLGLAQPTPLVL